MKLLVLQPDNPRWQRWLYLAEGRLADALLGHTQAETGAYYFVPPVQGGPRLSPAEQRERIGAELDAARKALADRDVKPDPAPVEEDRGEPPVWARGFTRAYERYLRTLSESPEEAEALTEMWRDVDRITAPYREQVAACLRGTAVDEAQEAAVVGRDVLGRAASPLPKSGPTCDWCGGSRQMPRYEDGVRRGTNPCLKCSGGPTEPVDESEVGRG